MLTSEKLDMLNGLLQARHNLLGVEDDVGVLQEPLKVAGCIGIKLPIDLCVLQQGGAGALKKLVHSTNKRGQLSSAGKEHISTWPAQATPCFDSPDERIWQERSILGGLPNSTSPYTTGPQPALQDVRHRGKVSASS